MTFFVSTYQTEPCQFFPGHILQLQSADELVNAISRAVAPFVLQHNEERRSWHIIRACAAPALLAALRAGRVRWSVSLLLGSAFWQAAGTVNMWLHRQQEHEADEVAAVFSTAAGCKPDGMLTSLQRAYCASQTAPQALCDQLQRSRSIHVPLDMLSPQWLSKASIPSDLTQGSTAVQQIKDAAAGETKWATLQRLSVNYTVGQLEGHLAEELCAIRNPWKGLTSPLFICWTGLPAEEAAQCQL